MTPQHTKMAQEDLECLVAAQLTAGMIGRTGVAYSDAASAVGEYQRILTELRKTGIYGNIRDRAGGGR